nr:hypothetical protein [Tanacetum cinerariifolium]
STSWMAVGRRKGLWEKLESSEWLPTEPPPLLAVGGVDDGQ